MKLIELLAVVAIIAVLACLLLGPLGRAYRTAKLWCWGIAATHSARVECLDTDDWRALEQPTFKWYAPQ